MGQPALNFPCTLAFSIVCMAIILPVAIPPVNRRTRKDRVTPYSLDRMPERIELQERKKFNTVPKFPVYRGYGVVFNGFFK